MQTLDAIQGLQPLVPLGQAAEIQICHISVRQAIAAVQDGVIWNPGREIGRRVTGRQENLDAASA
jgi:hypothetical protein